MDEIIEDNRGSGHTCAGKREILVRNLKIQRFKACTRAYKFKGDRICN